MKRYLLALSAALIMLAFFNPLTASAIDMSAGVYTWYSWWDFPEDEYDNTKTDPGLIYGPTLSVNINEFCSLTFVFLYGEFDAKGESTYYLVNAVGPVNYYTYDIKRYDSDTALNFKLNSYFKLYAGVKYLAFSYKLNGSFADADFDHKSFGPAAGLSVTIPVVQNLFIIGNAGGLYLRGHESYSDSIGYSNKFKIKDYGYNTGLSLAYYIEPASTSVSLGGRYQYVKTEYDDGFSNKSKFYGITLSAAYMFSI